MTSKIVVNNIEADAGISTVTFGSEISASTFNGNIVGTSATFTGNVSVAGVLTYEDVTSVDAVGLSTFQNGIHVTGGSVGIGTNNPGAKLDLYAPVNSNALEVHSTTGNVLVANINVPSSGGGAIQLRNASGTTTFEVDARDNQNAFFNTGGSVGIGTDNPNSKLEIWNNSNIEVLRLRDTHFNKYLTIRGGGSPNRMVIDAYEGGGGGADIDLASNGSTKVRITSSGKIGINSTSPLEIVDIVDDAPRIDVSATNGTSGFRLNVASGYGGQTFRVQEAGATVFTIQNGGDIVIPNGKGIDFSATSDGSGASNVSELFDDYEEGRFNVTIHNANVGTTYPDSNFRYTKIGNVVYWNGRISWSGLTAGTYNELTGFPFTMANTTENVNYPMTTNIYVNSGLTLSSGKTYVIAYAQPNTTRYYFTQQITTTALFFNSSGNLYLTGFYYA